MFKRLPWLALIYCLVQQALKGTPLAGVLLCCSSQQALKGPLSLGSFCIYQLPVPMCGGRESLQWWLHLVPDSAVLLCLHGCPISSKGMPCSNLLPHIPLGHLPAVKSHPRPGVSLQPLCLCFQSRCVWGALHPCLGYVGLWYRLSVWFSHYSDYHRLVASLPSPFKCLPSSPNYCSDMGNLTPASVPPLPRGRSSLYILVFFFPPSFILLSFAWVSIFLSSGQGLLLALSWCSVRY